MSSARIKKVDRHEKRRTTSKPQSDSRVRTRKLKILLREQKFIRTFYFSTTRILSSTNLFLLILTLSVNIAQSYRSIIGL